MKWSSTAAALVVLAMSAPVHADLYSRYQQESETPDSAVGPEIALPAPTEETSALAPADGGTKKNKQKSKAKNNAQEQGEGVGGAADESADPSPSDAPSASALPHQSTYGGAQRCGAAYDGDYGAAAHCCKAVNPKAMHCWDNYCSSKNAGWFPGWLAVRHHCQCCPTCAPRPFLPACKCKPHFGRQTIGCAPSVCDQCDADACGSAPCDACGNAPCQCGKHGGLLSGFFARFSAKHHGVCPADDCSDVLSASEIGEGEIYSNDGEAYSYDGETGDAPLPPPPVVPEEEPAEAPQAQAAKRGLLPQGFRLFPIGR